MKLMKGICWLICPIIILAYGWELVLVLPLLPQSPSLRSTGWGFFAGCVFWPIVLRHLQFWQNLEHELTHSVVALLFLRNIRSLEADHTEGRVSYDGPGSNFVIILAPYCLPTLSLLWLALLPLIRQEYLRFYFVFLGFLTGYDAFSNLQEYHLQQPDIQECGAVFSALFSTAATIILNGLICGIVIDGRFGAFSFISGGYGNFLTFVGSSLDSLRGLSRCLP